MAQSKGGHAAKDEDKDSVFRFMVEFEDQTIDTRDIKRIRKHHRASTNELAEEGIEYVITIMLYSPPNEYNRVYFSKESRDNAFAHIRSLLIQTGTIIVR